MKLRSEEQVEELMREEARVKEDAREGRRTWVRRRDGAIDTHSEILGDSELRGGQEDDQPGPQRRKVE